jgi:predicted metal-dependent phosphoesterase TrpH
LPHRVENSELKREANTIMESCPCVQDSDNDSDDLDERIDEMKCIKAQLLAEHGCVACVQLRFLGMITENTT